MPSQAAKWQQVLQRKMQSMAEKPMNIRHMNINELVNKLNFWYGFEIILDFQLVVQNKKKANTRRKNWANVAASVHTNYLMCFWTKKISSNNICVFLLAFMKINSKRPWWRHLTIITVHSHNHFNLYHCDHATTNMEICI